MSEKTYHIIFNTLSSDEIERYLKNSDVFNVSKETLLNTEIPLYSFEDEKLGYSREKIDIVIIKDNRWKLLNCDKYDEYNIIPLSYALNNTEYDSVLIVIRRMSNMILDTVNGNVTSTIYNVMPNKYKKLETMPTLSVTLAKNKIYVNTENTNEIIERIDSNEEIDDYTKSYLIKELKKF